MMSDLACTEANDSRTMFGFWTYLMTDCVLFASLFAVFAVLRAPGSYNAFDLTFVLTETVILLTSSFTMGLALLAARAGSTRCTLLALGATLALGISFVALEFSEFSRLVAAGSGPSHSGFFSAYFTLVGTHGLHVAAGLVWMLLLGGRILQQGLSQSNLRKMALLSLFWHFLDIIWIFIFSIVYLGGIL